MAKKGSGNGNKGGNNSDKQVSFLLNHHSYWVSPPGKPGDVVKIAQSLADKLVAAGGGEMIKPGK